MHEQTGVAAELATLPRPDRAKVERLPETFSALEEVDRELEALTDQLQQLSETVDVLSEKLGPVLMPDEVPTTAPSNETMSRPKQAYASTIASRVAGNAGRIENAADMVGLQRRRLTLLTARIEL